MAKIKVAVLLGGESSERKISLISGKKVAAHIPKNKYRVSIYDTKNQLLKLINDIKKKKIDVVFPVLHGKFGEDGTIQGLLELLHIPYVGCGVLASSLCMDKVRTKQIISSANIKTPAYILLHKKQNITYKDIKLPCVVKPIDSGSSVGTSIAKKLKDLKKGIQQAFIESDIILIEEYIDGKEFTVGVIGNENIRVFPPTEIISNISSFYDYKAKYKNKGSTHYCPANIDNNLSTKLKKLTKEIYKLVGAKGMSRVDFMWAKKNNQLYFIEINTIPGMTDTSLLPEAAKTDGLEFPDLLDQLIQLALK